VLCRLCTYDDAHVQSAYIGSGSAGDALGSPHGRGGRPINHGYRPTPNHRHVNNHASCVHAGSERTDCIGESFLTTVTSACFMMRNRCVLRHVLAQSLTWGDSATGRNVILVPLKMLSESTGMHSPLAIGVQFSVAVRNLSLGETGPSMFVSATMARAPSHTNARYRLATRRLIFADTPFDFCPQHARSLPDNKLRHFCALSLGHSLCVPRFCILCPVHLISL